MPTKPCGPARLVGIFLQEHAGKIWADENWQMDVTEESGLILFVITVQALKSAATSDLIKIQRHALPGV
jgi:hypothetical protein